MLLPAALALHTAACRTRRRRGNRVGAGGRLPAAAGMLRHQTRRALLLRAITRCEAMLLTLGGGGQHCRGEAASKSVGSRRRTRGLETVDRIAWRAAVSYQAADRAIELLAAHDAPRWRRRHSGAGRLLPLHFCLADRSHEFHSHKEQQSSQILQSQPQNNSAALPAAPVCMRRSQVGTRLLVLPPVPLLAGAAAVPSGPEGQEDAGNE